MATHGSLSHPPSTPTLKGLTAKLKPLSGPARAECLWGPLFPWVPPTATDGVPLAGNLLGALGCCPAYALHIQLNKQCVKPMSKKTPQMPRFKSESEEADWWASPAGRAYVTQKSAEAQSKGAQAGGSSLVAKLNKKSSIQIAIRLPGADLAQARKIADRKGIGYPYC